MENDNEFMEYIKRNLGTVKENFRRRILIQCLEEYRIELAERRNFYKDCSKEFNYLEERRKELVKIERFVKEEMWDTCIYEVTSENKQENQKE